MRYCYCEAEVRIAPVWGSVRSTFVHSIFKGIPSKEGFHRTHRTPSGSSTANKSYNTNTVKFLHCNQLQQNWCNCDFWKMHSPSQPIRHLCPMQSSDLAFTHILTEMYFVKTGFHSVYSCYGFKVGQPWISNLQVMWTNDWVKSKCSQGSQNVCTKLLSAPDNANFYSLAKIKICTLSLTTSSTHTQNQWKP